MNYMETNSDIEAIQRAYRELVAAADALYRAADGDPRRSQVTELIDLLETAVAQAIDGVTVSADRGLRPLR
jgi:hypothetical protein